ncbi:MAG: NlpC/P60 family protein [Ignavibacteria bacterium]|nr:NlpC/P60 family protein [Ignavibacteria bacterium]
MKYIIYTYLLTLILVYSPMILSQTHLEQSVEARLTELQKQYAPDKRTAICDVHVKSDNGGTVTIFGETNKPELVTDLLKFCKNQSINVKNDVTVLPGDNLKGKNYAVVALSVVNIRKGPDHPEEMVTQSLMGTVLRVYKLKQGFCLVQTPDDYLGWVDDDVLFHTDAKSVNEYIASEKIIITGMAPYCYSQPDVSSQTVTDLVAGNLLRVTGSTGTFYNVTLPDGRKGYVQEKDAYKFTDWAQSRANTPEAILTTAKRFMGTPYLWGGMSSKGVDCSGFTKSVYFLNGYILPRDASQQVFTGDFSDDSLDLKKLKPADLVFFGKKNTGKPERATHVGIYLGNGEFIHSSGRVRINSFVESSEIFSEYRTKMYLRARTILNTSDKAIVRVLDSKYYFPHEELQ